MPPTETDAMTDEGRPRPPSADPRVALALFYATHFGHLGVVLPFLPLWFASRGLGSSAIGLLVALVPLAKVPAPWVWGRLADRTGRRRELLVSTGVVAATALVLLPRAVALPSAIAIMAVYAWCLAPSLPLAEATALEQSEARGFAYGRVRLWGSLAFVAVSAGTGALVDSSPGRGALYAASALLVLAAVSAARFPSPAVHVGRRRASVPGGLRRVLGDRSLWRLLAACALMQASHGPYYGFYSIRLESLGYAGAAIGALWAFAVIAEVGLLTRVDRILDRLGAITVLRLSLLAAAARWLLIATATDGAVLAAGQALHAATYAAFHVAALREIHRRFRPEDRATGQALYSGLSFGAGIFTGTLAAGLLADRLGLPALFAAAAATAATALLVLGRPPEEATD